MSKLSDMIRLALTEGSMKELVTKHMEAGHDFKTASEKAKKELGSMKEEAEELDERNKENKFKKDVHVVKSGKAEIAKGINFAKYQPSRIADIKGHDYGIATPDHDDDPEFGGHSSRKTTIRTLKVAGRAAIRKEEVEQIDELSIDTMKSYGDKRARTAFSGGRKPGQSVDAGIKMKNKQINSLSLARTKINRVHDTGSTVFNKEEAEQIDESAKIAAHLIKRYGDNVRPSHIRSAAADFGVDATKLAKAVRKRLGKTMLEAKDSHEYDYEGEMVMNQLAQMEHHIGELKAMLKPDTNLPEWVQSKITLANDYLQTASDYMNGEMKEETEMELEEGRGRPPKPGSEAHKRALEGKAKDPAEHIINRMGQAATNMTGGQHHTYNDGQTHRVSNALAARTLTHYRSLKPADKEKFQERIAKSHQDHLDALAGK
jgi:hypothetical protein